jgi:hypothetical protein
MRLDLGQEPLLLDQHTPHGLVDDANSRHLRTHHPKGWQAQHTELKQQRGSTHVQTRILQRR